MKNSWFEVDKKGLQQIQNNKDKTFIVNELVSNAFDEKTSRINIIFSRNIKGYNISIYDDSEEGFKDLRDAYTMFAPSYKKSNPNLRGRFNIGEKFVLSMFDHAKITSTKGCVRFLKDGTRKKSSEKIERGTIFSGFTKKLKRNDWKFIRIHSRKIIPPIGINYLVNSIKVERPQLLHNFEETLPSITTDDEGNLVNTSRKTNIELFKSTNSVGCIYELGIPVVELDIPYLVNVNQKIPLNKDRDNVKPAYLKKLNTVVLDQVSSELSKEQLKANWVSEGMEKSTHKAVKDVLDGRYGEDAVVFDMSDSEANKKAFADDINVVTGGAFNKNVWDNIREARTTYEDLARPSGSVGKYASPNMSGNVPAPLLDKSKITKEMKQVFSLARKLHLKLFNQDLNVEIFDCYGLGGNRFSATYGGGFSGADLGFYYKSLGKSWFDLKTNKLAIIKLIIHEFGHYYSSDHLSKQYYKGLCEIGAKLYCKEYL
jgi:hypothetical protein